MRQSSPVRPLEIDQDPLRLSIRRAGEALLSDQTAEGYWWYTLEANETIGAGFVQLMHWLGIVDRELEEGLLRRILSEQRSDGSWSLFFEGPPDLSTTIECYFALRLGGLSTQHPSLKAARRLIQQMGGLSEARVFTKIHLALFGLVPWSECPAMPLWVLFLPVSSGFSIYEFSSWSRASIVPLLIILNKKMTTPVSFNLDELKSTQLPLFEKKQEPFSRKIFYLLDRLFKKLDRLPWHPGRKTAMKLAEKWIRDHIERTEDIYPAMAYAAIAMKALGYPLSDPTIRKALGGLKKFQQTYDAETVGCATGMVGPFLHQQCCISPLWDTPWASRALLESGIPSNDPALLKSARYLISKQIASLKGDWSFKNKRGEPGGWAFEFQNDYYPDLDDTIEILYFLKKVALPAEEKNPALEKGLRWLLSMQSKNGGWAAFDKDNLSSWVNRIPFSDHGACLDPPTPDITGRAVELLSLSGFRRDDPVLRKALQFLRDAQRPDGSWKGRWGVNFIYGTWAVLRGLRAQGIPKNNLQILKAVDWLKSIQNYDGGWGESCLSDEKDRYVPLGLSLPSQTAWAILGLIAAGEYHTPAVRRGVEFLIDAQRDDGRWEERHFTGTGFPGHFYIRYHGYRLYFPLLALATYQNYKDF